MAHRNGATSLADPNLQTLLERAEIDPGDGLQVIALDRLVSRPFDAGMALLVLPPVRPPAPAEPQPQQGDTTGNASTALPGRHAHGDDPAAMLRRLYPPDHPVVGASTMTTIAQLDTGMMAATPYLIPPLDPLANPAGAFGLAWLVHRLRQPDGCPWDREQDHETLKPFLLEETYEVYDALSAGSTPQLAEELGDLLLQIVLHAQYAAEEGVFDLSDVQRGIVTKIVRRHPHVFGDVVAETPAAVMRNWEQLKAAERAEAAEAADAADRAEAAELVARADAAERAEGPGAVAMPAAFAGLSRSLPALAYADEMQARAASLGYDWPDLEGVIDKIAEEATELLAATDLTERREEFGDLLFVLVNMGRKLGIDSEAALRSASQKFAGRFARVERLADEQGLELRALGLDALDDLWQEAKREESRRAEARRDGSIDEEG